MLHVMKLVLSHGSALEFWRAQPARQQAQPCATRLQALPESVVPDADAAAAILDAGLDLRTPVQILVDATGRGARRDVLQVRSTSLLPTRSLLRVADDVLVVCPELCFLQMASVLPLVDLVRVGYELCGTYAECDGIRYGCEPVTSPTKLCAYVRRAKGVDGVRGARRALRSVLPDSASPMETVLVMLLCLPRMLGGYGLPAPQLNGRVEVNRRRGALVSQEFYVCDLLWRDAGVAIEYDSTTFHSGADRMARDARRRGELAALGVHIETVTSEQVFHWAQTDKLAARMAKLLKVRVRPPDARSFEERARLRAALLPLDGTQLSSPVRLSDVVC